MRKHVKPTYANDMVKERKRVNSAHETRLQLEALSNTQDIIMMDRYRGSLEINYPIVIVIGSSAIVIVNRYRGDPICNRYR